MSASLVIEGTPRDKEALGRYGSQAILRGEPPLPLIFHLIDSSLDRIEDGRPERSASGAAIRERNQ